MSPKSYRLVSSILHNEWSDEARKKSAESRKRKAQQRGSWLGSTAKAVGKAGLIAGGVVAGGLLGGRIAPRVFGKGRLARVGENLTGKVVYTVPPKNLEGFEKWSIGAAIPVGRKRSLGSVLEEQGKRAGLRGRVARRLSAIEKWFGIPERHYGVGTDKGHVTHFSPHGVKKHTKGEFGAYWSERMSDREPRNIWVVDEGLVSGKKGSVRKAELAAVKSRLAARRNWRGRELRCLGKKNCETFAREISSGRKQYKSRLALTGAAGIAGGGTTGGAVTGAATLLGGKKKKDSKRRMVRNVLQVINGGPGSGFRGHKGRPGQRGGSAPEGGGMLGSTTYRPASLPLSESPQARAKRIKLIYTKASRLADVYGDHANKLEQKRRSKLLPLNRRELIDLLEAHKNAADNFRASAEQSTLVKRFTPEQQLQRLEQASRHEEMAAKYLKRLNREIPGKDFVKAVGKTFLGELVGDLPSEIGRMGADITRESIRGGFKSLVGKSPSLGKFGEGVFKGGKAKAEEYKNSILEGGRIRDKSKMLRAAMEEVKRLQAIDKNIKKQLHALGGRVSRGKPKSASEKPKQFSADAIRKALIEAANQKLADAEERVLASNEFTALVSNLEGQVRRETLHDREYLVAPLTMIVPGVLAGSKGPLLYPEEEVAKNPSAWNGMPIVVNHPMKDGMPVEARNPAILNQYQIGTVFNTKYNGKLVAEGWFDVDRTRKTNIGIYEQLVNNRPIELSTGLYTDNESSEGTWNGRPYSYVARNYRPDHLAILLGSKGACSIKDGCGVLINETDPVTNIVQKTGGGYKLVSHKGKNLGTAKTKAGILKRERQVEYFKHVRNEVREVIDLINNGPYRAAAGSLWKAVKLGGGQAIKDVLGVAKKTSKTRRFIKKFPKTSTAVAAGGIGYAAGKRKRSQTNNALKAGIVNIPFISKNRAKARRQVAGFAGGAAAGAYGTVKGAAIGTAVGGPVGGIIGGAAGGATGAWGARKIAKRLGGSSAESGADLGGLAGTFAPIGSGAARAAGAAVKASRTKRIIGGAGRLGADYAAYEGTTRGLDKLASKFSRRRKRSVVSNAWTEEARRKSLETRRRHAVGGTDIGLGIAGGMAVGKIGSKLVEPEIDAAVDRIRQAIIRSFKDVKRNPGLGRRVIRLLKSIRRV
jgi:hypothetical protein